METLKIFCSYAPEDKDLMAGLHKQLRLLEPQSVSIWYMHDVLPGREWERERDRQLQEADLILLLVSSNFLGPGEQSTKEVPRAMQRHERGEASVLPIILRPVLWQDTLFGKLVSLPSGGRTVTDRAWKTQDHAFFNVAKEVKRVIDDLRTLQPNLLNNSQPALSNIPPNPGVPPHTESEAIAHLNQLIQNFRHLRGQIANFARLQREPGFTIESCENQYNNLYGDTMVFLATYLPKRVSDDEEGFVTVVYRKAQEQLRKRGDLFVTFTRMVIGPLARIEKVAEQIDACVATLEFYKQKYFPASAN